MVEEVLEKINARLPEGVTMVRDEPFTRSNLDAKEHEVAFVSFDLCDGYRLRVCKLKKREWEVTVDVAVNGAFTFDLIVFMYAVGCQHEPGWFTTRVSVANTLDQTTARINKLFNRIEERDRGAVCARSTQRVT